MTKVNNKIIQKLIQISLNIWIDKKKLWHFHSIEYYLIRKGKTTDAYTLLHGWIKEKWRIKEDK